MDSEIYLLMNSVFVRFRQNLSKYIVKIGNHSLQLFDIRCYEENVISEAKNL